MARPRKPKVELDLNVYTKTGKLRKRKPKKSRNYFTQETQDSIIEFVAETDPDIRNKIFREKINPSFHKLVENLIHSFKFYYTETDNVIQLQTEVVSFLYQKLHLYDPSKGMAFSYFGTIAKHWLTTYNRDNYKALKDRADLDEVDEDKGIYIGLMNENVESDVVELFDKFIQYVEKRVNTLFKKPMEQEICDAVVMVFKNREKLEKINKQSFYLYIKEITGYAAPQITKVIKELKQLFVNLHNDYYLNGDIYI